MYYLYKKYKVKRQREAEAARLAAGQDDQQVEPSVDGDGSIQPLKERNQITKTNPRPGRSIEPEEDPAIKRQRRMYRLKLCICLFPSAFLAALDTTVVATSLTTIASQFDQLNQFNWIVTAYTLTSTAFVPAFGQIADTFGRHFALQLSLLFMILGSVLCAAAQNWTMLLFGRAFQGFSSAGCMNMIKIILADRVSLAEQSKNSTVFAIVTGLSYAVGPVIGGYIAHSNWRYIFVISIGVAVIGCVLIFFFLRKELLRGSHHITGPKRTSIASALSTIDYGGTFLFVVGVCLIILATAWGGTTYPWDSYHVLVPLILGSVLFVAFFIWEYLMEPGRLVNNMLPKQVPMIPFLLFKRLDSLLLAVINAATGAALYSAFYFVGIFWTLVEGYTSSKAGLQLLYYTPGIGVGSYAAMAMCNFFPRQTFYPLFLGSVIEAAGFSVLAWATRARRATIVNVMMAVSGGGTGLRMMPGTLHAAGVWPQHKAAVISLMDFALPFGGTLAITIMSSVFYNKFDREVAQLAAVPGSNGDVGSRNSTSSINAINSLPQGVQDQVHDIAGHAVMWSFISVLPIMALSMICAALLGNIWISPKSAVGDAKENRGEVIHSSYLAALFTGKIKQRKVPVDAATPQEAVKEEAEVTGDAVTRA